MLLGHLRRHRLLVQLVPAGPEVHGAAGHDEEQEVGERLDVDGEPRLDHDGRLWGLTS